MPSLKSVPAADLIFGHGVYSQHRSPHHKSEKQKKIVSLRNVDGTLRNRSISDVPQEVESCTLQGPEATCGNPDD